MARTKDLYRISGTPMWALETFDNETNCWVKVCEFHGPMGLVVAQAALIHIRTNGVPSIADYLNEGTSKKVYPYTLPSSQASFATQHTLSDEG